jgi:5,10-methenyltetrahydromethanopterin hydrogenase
MLALEKTFIDALLQAVQGPSEQSKHMATESLRDLLNMYQEDTIKKIAAIGEHAGPTQLQDIT